MNEFGNGNNNDEAVDRLRRLRGHRHIINNSANSANDDRNDDHDAIIDVGTPRRPMGWSTTYVRYHDFANLPCRRGLDHTDSPPFRVHGIEWYLRLHPGGAASSSNNVDGDNSISLYLRCKTASESNVSIMAEFTLAISDDDGRVCHAMSCPRNAFRRKRKGWPNFASRCRILDPSSRMLDEYGTLTILVGVQLHGEGWGGTNYHVPKNAVVGLYRLFVEANPNNALGDDDDVADRVGGVECDSNDIDEVSPTKDTADVIFSFQNDDDGEEGEGEGETLIRAHMLILKLSAPALAQLCEGYDVAKKDGGDDDGRTPTTVVVSILGVRSLVFKIAMRYAYGDTIPDWAWTTTNTKTTTNAIAITTTAAATRDGVGGIGNGDDRNGDGSNDEDDATALLDGPAFEILDAANRFGIVGLKILAETRIIERIGINARTFSDLILYADARDCALLKECCIDYYASHPREVRRQEDYGRVRESAGILDELMDALLSRPVLRRDADKDDVDYETMGVNLLRRISDGRGLDVDGSREMLTRRLRRWDGRNRTMSLSAKGAGSMEE